MEKQTREDVLMKYYNNCIEVLEGEDSYYWTLGEAKKYANGYLDALLENEMITSKEAWNMYNEIMDAIIEIHEKESK